jgi:hypothetical protein
MSVVRGVLGLAIAAAGVLTSCSLIVQFHDQPVGDEASAPGDDAAMNDDAAPDGTVDTGIADTGSSKKDAGPAPDHYAPCSGLINGYYCANDGPHDFTGPSNDLLVCDEGGIGQTIPCDGGCVDLPAPFPDACNPCVGVDDGLYCGRDLAGFPAENADFLIQCQSGNTVQQVACLHGCGSDGKMSSCNQ